MSSWFKWCKKIIGKYPVTSKSIFGVVTLLSARHLYLYVSRKINKYPPGPIGIPFFGSLFSCIDIANFASYLASNYGPITMIYIGQQSFIFLHSIDIINTVFTNSNAIDREFNDSTFLSHLKHFEYPTASINMSYWPRKRKMFQSVMIARLNSSFINLVHNYSLTHHVNKSIEECINCNKLWYPSNDINYIAFHFIWYALFGSFLEYENKEREINIKYLNDTFAEAGTDVVFKYLGIKNTGFNASSFKKFGEHIEKVIYRELNYDESVFDMNDKKWTKHFNEIIHDKNACVMSKIIAAHRKDPDIDSTKKSIISEALQILTAGVHTVMHTSEYGIVLLAKYPEIQDLIYKELIQIYSSDDILMNKIDFHSVFHNFHYLRACTHEILRISSVLPTGVPHYNSSCNINVNNKYIIPKGSVIMADIATANRKDSYWNNKKENNGMNVNISSWLDENNHFKYNLNKDKFMTFSVGPRDCAGSALALRTLYILFAKLIMSFKFVIDKNKQIKQKYEFAFLIHPKIPLNVSKR